MWSMSESLYVVLTKSKFTSRTLAFDLAVQITRYLEFQGGRENTHVHFSTLHLCGRLWVLSALALRWFAVAWEHSRWPCCLRFARMSWIPYSLCSPVVSVFFIQTYNIARYPWIVRLSCVSFCICLLEGLGVVHRLISLSLFFFKSLCLIIVFLWVFFLPFLSRGKYPFQSSRLPSSFCLFLPYRQLPNHWNLHLQEELTK